MLKLRDNITTDYDIQALIDNELDWEQEKTVRSAINNDPKLKERYTALKTQKTMIQNWWKNKAH